jgi:heavy metal sensor kinase
MRISNSVIPGAAGRAYLLQVGVPLAETDAVLSRYRGLLLGGALPALLIGALASWWVSAFALAPLVRMATAARVIDVQALDQRLTTRGARDELDSLAEAFNETLGRLEQTIGEMRQFSAALAHELRTPMAALRGEIDLALRGAGADEAQRAAFASQIEEIDRLRRLTDQILTLARADAGEIPLTFSRTDMGDLAASLVDQLVPVAEARGITLSCERPDAAMVSGDAAWLRRLLLNLIDNALKFTGEGGRVLVRVSQEAGRVSIQVRDTGIGMPPEVARRAFERFFRGDSARSSATEGAGLGLSLAHWIVGRHHGAITVESTPGEGSTFTVTLPGPEPELLLLPEAARAVTEGLRRRPRFLSW